MALKETVTLKEAILSTMKAKHEIPKTCNSCKEKNKVAMLLNKLTLAEEDIECVHMYLDKENIRTYALDNKSGKLRQLSINGRIKYLIDQKTEELKKENEILKEVVKHISDEGWWGAMNTSEDLVEILDEHKKAADKALDKVGKIKC